jgi:hypothetical protein
MAAPTLDAHPLYQRLKKLLQEAPTLGERKLLAEALHLDCQIEDELRRKDQIGRNLKTQLKTKAKPDSDRRQKP